MAIRYGMLRWGVACDTIELTKLAAEDNPADANLVDDASKLPAHPFRIRVEADPVQAAPVR